MGRYTENLTPIRRYLRNRKTEEKTDNIGYFCIRYVAVAMLRSALKILLDD
jgi:hypothetical protein